MGSVAAQHIEDLADATRSEAYWKVATICTLRREGIYSEDQIAKKVGFERKRVSQGRTTEYLIAPATNLLPTSL